MVMAIIVSSASRPGVLAKRLIPHVLLLSSTALATGDIDDSRRTAVVRAVERVQPAVVSVHVIPRPHENIDEVLPLGRAPARKK